MATATKHRAAQVVAFTTDGTTEQLINEVLQHSNLTDKLVRRGDMKAATQYIMEATSPELLIVDVSGSNLPLSDIQNLAQHCEPRVHVIVLGDKNDVGLFRELVSLGVTDYIVKPLTRELLQRSVEKALGLASTSTAPTLRTGKLVAVTGARGGVGATTLLANVGWLLADREGRRVTLMDVDLHNGSLGLMMDVKPTRGLRDGLENAGNVDELYVERLLTAHSERLSVVCGEVDPDDAVKYDLAAAQSLVETLRTRSHYVLVDVPRRPDPIFQHILKLADVRIIVADQTLGSVRDMIRQIRPADGGTAAQRAMLVVNRRSQPSKGDIAIEDMERTLDRKIDHLVPYGRGGITAAANLGELATTNRNPVTSAMAKIAADLSGGGEAAAKTPWKKKLLRSA